MLAIQTADFPFGVNEGYSIFTAVDSVFGIQMITNFVLNC
jgi:hypothetical protein